MFKGCSKCGTDNSSDARFCRSCGAKLEAPAATEPPPQPACRACGHMNRPGTRFCAKCGADQAPPVFVAPPAPPASPGTALPPAPAAIEPKAATPLALWIGIGALVLALAAGGGVWWVKHARSTALPTFDSAPPPSVLAASAPAAAPIETAPASVAAPMAAPAPVGDPPEPAAKETVITEPAEKPALPARDAAKETAREAAKETSKEKAARDAKAKALREQRAQAASQAEADLARRRADEARARAAPPAPTPVPRTPNPVPPPPQARTVQERCANLNPLAKGICEARECVRPEHAAEVVCQRIKAADDRRREQ